MKRLENHGSKPSLDPDEMDCRSEGLTTARNHANRAQGSRLPKHKQFNIPKKRIFRCR